MVNTVTVLLTIFFFLLPLLYKKWKKEKVELSDLLNCALAAMSLPNLFIYIYYQMANPLEATKMAEQQQYSLIGVLTILFITADSILKVFARPPTP